MLIINGVLRSEEVGGGTEWGDPSPVTISGGVISVLGPGWYEVDTEASAASDDLDIINGLQKGDEIMLSIANNGRVVVLKNGTGNISIGVDTTLNATTDRMRLQYDGVNLVEASSRP